VADPPGAERIDIAAEINAARNALLAMSPEERASHLKRTAERMQEWPRKIGTDLAHHARCPVVRLATGRS
jgi:acyl-CoA reductase-like NAD-dependent aldehyde dehydrogenase